MMVQDNFVRKLAAEDKRMDGRMLDELRKIVIEKNPISKADGSALVRLGKTQVLAGVKLDVGKPFSDKPDEGVLITSAEFSPISSPDFELGPPRDDSIELARIVDRGIRESGAVDMKKLCVEEKEKVWMLNIDISILDNFGNLIDAAALASAVAIKNAVFPKYEDGAVVFREKTKKKLPVKYFPVACTFARVGTSILLDPSREEENASTARLTITTRDDGDVCAIQKGGSGELAYELIEKALDLSVKTGKEIRKMAD